MSKKVPTQCPLPFRRGLNRVEAASFCGIGPTLFDRMVADGRMPRPKCADGRKVWDTAALAAALEELPDDGADQPRPENEWDSVL